MRLRPLLPAFALLLAGCAFVILAGCAYVTSTTLRSTDPKTGIVTERTRARAVAFLDAKGTLQKFRNTPGGSTSNAWVGGTSIGSLDQTATSSNLVTIIGDAAAIAKMLHP